jgi:nicotinate phosphoribosyltransferase
MFHIATPEDIKSGRVTDVYFEHATAVLRAKGIRKHVLAEVRTTSLPRGCDWAILAGVEEAAHLLSGLPATVRCMPEGMLFKAGEPVLSIEGEYTDWAVYETALLGLLCQASGVATKAARCRLAAGEKLLLSFGARRMHPALAPMIERNAYIGGCDGVAVTASADLIGITASGTMPHALVLVVGDAVKAFRMFNEVMPSGVPRICLVDTLCDEKVEAIAAAEALGDALQAVRLDTPGSRRGDMAAIAQEVRWELDLRGHRHVKIFISGGLDEDEILKLNQCADGYGVGTAISNAAVINFALDIVEVEGTPFTKRGKPSGRKDVLRCPACGARKTLPAASPATCACGAEMEQLLQPLTEMGEVVREPKPAPEIRKYVIEQIGKSRELKP